MHGNRYPTVRERRLGGTIIGGVFVAAAGVCFFGVTADSTADSRRQQGRLGGPGAKTGRLCGKSS